jgi:hypothetical protein
MAPPVSFRLFVPLTPYVRHIIRKDGEKQVRGSGPSMVRTSHAPTAPGLLASQTSAFRNLYVLRLARRGGRRASRNSEGVAFSRSYR